MSLCPLGPWLEEPCAAGLPAAEPAWLPACVGMQEQEARARAEEAEAREAEERFQALQRKMREADARCVEACGGPSSACWLKLQQGG